MLGKKVVNGYGMEDLIKIIPLLHIIITTLLNVETCSIINLLLFISGGFLNYYAPLYNILVSAIQMTTYKCFYFTNLNLENVNFSLFFFFCRKASATVTVRAWVFK